MRPDLAGTVQFALLLDTLQNILLPLLLNIGLLALALFEKRHVPSSAGTVDGIDIGNAANNEACASYTPIMKIVSLLPLVCWSTIQATA